MNNDDLAPNDEEQIASMLKVAGLREALPPELEQRWSDHFQKEVNATIQHRRKRLKYKFMACASIVVIIMAGLVNLLPLREEFNITVVQWSGSSVFALHNDKKMLLANGQILAPGSVLETSTATFLSIDYNQYDVRMNASTRLRVDSDKLTLFAGEIYVSSQPGFSSEGLTVETPLATIKNIGTQFTVSVLENVVTTSVRVGAISIETGNTITEATANNDHAQRVTINQSQEVGITATESSGAHWKWIYNVSEPFELEGQSVHNFLLWSVEESGLKLVYNDERAELYARSTLLHGQMPKQNPKSAVKPILATTHLIVVSEKNERLTVAMGATPL